MADHLYDEIKDTPDLAARTARIAGQIESGDTVPLRDLYQGPRATDSRYRLLHDDERFGLKAGDILVCESMHWAWAPEKVAVKYRESDGYEPGCSQYRQSVEWVSGPKL